MLASRRRRLEPFAPIFWRPATDAAAVHRRFVEGLLAGGAKGYRTSDSVLIAVPRDDGWLVDDAAVDGEDWSTGDGRELWNALAADVHGAMDVPVRVVCPVVEAQRAQFFATAGLSVAESWWLRELPGSAGGSPDARIPLPGADAITVGAPPVYDPPGPILFLPAPTDAATALPAAIAEAPALGCAAVVVNQAAGAAELADALVDNGFRRHCDYYVGPIRAV